MRLTLWKFGLGACLTWGCAVDVVDEDAAGQRLGDGGPAFGGGSGGGTFAPPTGGAPPATGGAGATDTGGHPSTGGSPGATGGTGATMGTGAQPSTGGTWATGGTGTGGSGGALATGGSGDAGALPPLFPEPVDVTTLPASPNNPAECPDVAPENPVGDCLGLPIYLNCQWGDDRRTYSCVCDWYHWLCL